MLAKYFRKFKQLQFYKDIDKSNRKIINIIYHGINLYRI